LIGTGNVVFELLPKLVGEVRGVGFSRLPISIHVQQESGHPLDVLEMRRADCERESKRGRHRQLTPTMRS